jgi:Regulator of ribonuclease activity B
MDSDYPDDDDGDALRQVRAAGADMSLPMTIEYSIAAPSLANARQLCKLIAPCGYDPQIYVDDEDQSVSIYCGRRMLATYDGVVSCQTELNRLCEPYGAQCNGWGTMGNALHVMNALAASQLRH